MKKRPEKTYSVAVVATMSAGKSTLLNAMVGHRLLPARTEADLFRCGSRCYV
ncbi:MAG: dynamin family protein [bacterium]|nr:dynamin family protein [bacterium]